MPSTPSKRRLKIRLREFKANSCRLLPRNHPLLKVLSTVPDEIDAAELEHRIQDWIALFED